MFAFFANSQTTEKKGGSSSIGLHAGWSSGYGLSYRYEVNDWEFMSVFSPIINRYNNWYSVGQTAMRTVHKGKNANMFLYLGGHYHYYLYEFNDFNGLLTMRNTQYMIGGFGYGIKIWFSENVFLSMQMGVSGSYYLSKRDYSYFDEGLIKNTNKHLSPDGGIGIFYNF